MIRRKIYSDDWEEQITNYTSEDIDEGSLKSFYSSARNCGRLDLEEYDKERLLTILNLMIDGANKNTIFWRVREEMPKIPVRTIREILINSFAHSKYVAETEHEINIFSSKVV